MSANQPSENPYQKIVSVPPIIRKTEALELTDPNIPGEIVVDEQGNLLKSYYEYEHVLGSLVETYDNWVTNIIGKQLAIRPFVLGNKGNVVVMNPVIYPPQIASSGNKKGIPLTPKMCRDSEYTYSSDLFADLVLNPGSPNEESIKQVFLGKIPVMLGSVLCHLRGKTERELLDMGECIKDPFGYFIIKGGEKVILMQEKLRVNKIFIFNSTSKGDVVCKMTCNTKSGSSNITLIQNKKNNALEIHLPFMGRSDSASAQMKKVGNTVSVFQIYRLLGVTQKEIILSMITLFIDPQYVKKAWVQLQPTFVELSQITDDIEYISKKKGLGDMEYTMKKSTILKDLKNDLFPNVPSENINTKLYMLSIMISRFVEYLIGIRPLDDRDNWGNKRIESAGRSLEQLFAGVWRELNTRIQDALDKKESPNLKDVYLHLNASFITDNFVNSFTANNWGVKGSYMPKENITDHLKRDTHLAVYSHLTKINTPTSRRAKQMKVRLVNMSQLGYVCAIETPEGQQCVTTDTPILKSDGTWINIGNVTKNSMVTTVDSKNMSKTPSNITNHFIYNTKTNGKKLYKLVTINSREIRATEDHPFLTLDGWKTTEELTSEDRVYVYPIMGPVSDKIAEEEILNENMFIEMMTGKIKKSLVQTHVNVLKEKGLLPLSSTSEFLPIIARMGGYTLADGTLSIYDKKPVINECFGQEEDAYFFEQDVARLGFNKCKISYRETEIVDKDTGRLTKHSTYRVQHSSALASLFIALGFSYGKKTETERTPIPNWIQNGSDLVKREFVSGFQGGDGTAIQAIKRKNKPKAYNISIGDTVQHISYEHKQSLHKFMQDMSKIITSLGVEISRVELKKGSDTDKWLSLYSISGKNENIIKYMDIIGYRYAKTKLVKGMMASEYLKYKMSKINERDNLKNSIISMYKSEYTIRQIADKMKIRYRLVSSVVEYWKKTGMSSTTTTNTTKTTTKTLAPNDTMNYLEFYKENIVKDDCIFIQVQKKELVDHDFVSDFTTIHDNHSFVANGFVTHNCGLVKNMALTNYISLDRNEDIVSQRIKPHISLSPSEQFGVPVMLNGKFIGWSDGKMLRDICVSLRRRKILFKDMAVVLPHNDFLYIYTDAARPTRPLLIVNENEELVIDKKNLWRSDMDTLLSEGCVEYIDAFEQEYIQLAQSVDDLYRRKAEVEEASRNYKDMIEKLSVLEEKRKTTPEGFALDDLELTITDTKEFISQAANILKELKSVAKYTHCEIDPTATMGLAASIIPLANHNQGPRLSYQCGMGKQSLGVYHSNRSSRFDTTAKTLAYPTRPLFETQMNEILGLNEMPAGSNVIVAIMTYTGYNQEDALIMNKASVDRGLFRQVIYKSTKSVQKKNEYFGRPEIRPDEPAHRYAAIDDNGLPILGAFVRDGDCIIGKIRKNETLNKIENASSYVGVGMKGVIDKVLVSKNAEGSKIVKVKIRQIRKPIPGDKYASRHAQKATIGIILPEEDMPFTLSGVKPDIIINPHCLPSRMTIAKLMEIVTSKVGVMRGERVNATAYRNFNIETFMSNLTEYGFSSSGKEVMFNGMTGKRMEARIFIGPCYYQALRHHVDDKIQSRSRGAIKQLSHQPVGGRARRGGQRFGEMERDAIISHGASEFLRERLCTVSDAYETVFCTTCGSIAIANNMSDIPVCRLCDEKAEFGTCTIPYAYKLMSHLLVGAGLKLTFDMSVKPKPMTEEVTLPKPMTEEVTLPKEKEEETEKMPQIKLPIGLKLPGLN